MKNKFYISLLAACVAGLSSCESDIDNFMVDDTIGLNKSGLVEAEVYTGLDDPYKVYVIKAGKGFQNAEVTLAVDDAVLTEYNQANGTQFTALAADCYTVTVNKLSFGNEDYRKYFEIKWDRDRLAQALEQDPNVVIPMKMSVAETGIQVDENRLTILVHPVITTPKIGIKKSGLITGLMPTRSSAIEEEVYMEVVSNFIAQQDIDYSFEIDPSMVETYNLENGTNYKLLPEEAYSFKLDGWSIKKFMNNSRFHFTFKRGALIPEDGPSLFGTYLLPFKLKSVSSSNIDQDNVVVLYTVDVVATKIDKAKWTIVDCNSNIADDPDPNTAKGDYGPENLIDGTSTKAWRSVWTVHQDLPYLITIDLGVNRDLYKIGFEAPTSANRRYSNSKAGYVEASLDGETWTKIADWTCANKNLAAVEFEVTPTTARFIRFAVTEVFGKVSGAKNDNATSIAEINAWGE